VLKACVNWRRVLYLISYDHSRPSVAAFRGISFKHSRKFISVAVHGVYKSHKMKLL
jgi:hypothetical protein